MDQVVAWIQSIGGLFTSGEWSAIWTFATFVVALIAAVVALTQFGHHIRTTREQSRPFVIVDFEFNSGLIMIEARNTGTTAARDVRFTWDPVPHADDDRSEKALQRALVEEGIPFLTPGRSIRFIMGDFTEELQPRRFTVTARYLGPSGHLRWKSLSVLDLDQWAQAIVNSDPATKAARSADRQAQAAEKTAKATEQLTQIFEPFQKVVMESAVYRRVVEREDAANRERWERLEALQAARRGSDDDGASPAIAPSSDSVLP